MNQKSEILAEIQTLEILNQILPDQYPKNSMIVLSVISEAVPLKFKCNWYDKTGVLEDGVYKNLVSNPPELDCISLVEATQLVNKFDKIMFLPDGGGFILGDNYSINPGFDLSNLSTETLQQMLNEFNT